MFMKFLLIISIIAGDFFILSVCGQVKFRAIFVVVFPLVFRGHSAITSYTNSYKKKLESIQSPSLVQFSSRIISINVMLNVKIVVDFSLYCFYIFSCLSFILFFSVEFEIFIEEIRFLRNLRADVTLIRIKFWLR